MSIFTPLVKYFSPSSVNKAIKLEDIGWNPVGGSSTYSYYRENNYENAFGSISVIANRGMVVEPYAIDENGKKQRQNLVIDALYHPNKDMDAVSFREALIIMSLVHPKVYLRVHTKGGGKVNARNISGFTFLENVTEVRAPLTNELTGYRVTSGVLEELTPDQVIPLSGFNPYDVTKGYSPAQAARRWTTLDDYIADYQAGFFRNGAVPAGQIIITARTAAEYRDIKKALQEHHQGAAKNNNITYAHRPIDETGKAQNASLEWVPFSQGNSKLELGSLFEQVNKKIDSTYIVPASMRAVNDNNTYASVRVDEGILIDNTVRPRLLKIYSQITHQLNRITGGLGFAITFDLETPNVADEDKIVAETKAIDVATLAELKTAGYTHKSAVEYLKTGDLEVLKIDQAAIDSQAQATTSTATEDVASVDNGDEVADAPNANKSVSKTISEQDRIAQERKIERVVKAQLKRQVETAIDNLGPQLANKAYGDATLAQDEQLAEDILEEAIQIVTIYGAIQTEIGRRLVLEAGLSTANIAPFYFTAKQRQEYASYMMGVAEYFNEQTAEMIRNTVTDGIASNLSKAEIEANLRLIMNDGFADYRATRIARSEVNRASGRASLQSMENIQRDTGYKITKIWSVRNANACQYCRAMDGREVDVDHTFVPVGGTIEGIDGGILENDFVSMEVSEGHPNCTCTMTFRVEAA